MLASAALRFVIAALVTTTVAIVMDGADDLLQVLAMLGIAAVVTLAASAVHFRWPDIVASAAGAAVGFTVALLLAADSDDSGLPNIGLVALYAIPPSLALNLTLAVAVRWGADAVRRRR